nr:twin-arginine translocation signal domain-containing protein [Actinomycetota bacterium]
MPSLNRRQFLVASGVTGGAALAAGATAVTWHQLLQRAASDPRPADASVLVVLTLYGGNDGLNTVVPYADSAYHDARPELAYAAGDVLHLDDQLGLNPGLTGLHKMWQDGRLAIVRGVGYPKPD